MNGRVSVVLVIKSARYAGKPEPKGNNRGGKGTRAYNSSHIQRESRMKRRVRLPQHPWSSMTGLISLTATHICIAIPEENHNHNLTPVSGGGQVGSCHYEVRGFLYLTSGRRVLQG